MHNRRQELMRSYLANTQVMLQTVSLTKVNSSWVSTNMVPEINRLYYILEGEGCIKVRGREWFPGPGQLVLMPAGVEQSYSIVREDYTYRKYWCHFSAMVGDIHLFQLLPAPVVVDVKDPARLEAQFNELIRLNKSKELTAPLRIKTILFELLSTFIELAMEQTDEAERFTSATPNVSKMNTILEHIDQHLAMHMTIEELAKLVHFHPNYFLNVFKSMLGVSPIVYINKKRMEKAQQLLLASDQPIAQIAEQFGMEPYYFSRMFKKLTGLSPSEYRKYNEYE
jgi:AraC-like DNA-binding protein